MPSAEHVYVKCDELDNIPKPNKENWLFEISLLKSELKENAKVLQIGCMDGTRILALLKERPDLIMSGLDIEKPLLDIAKEKFEKAGVNVRLIQGDILTPPPLDDFDYIICLNNTLGYIKEEKKAIENMKKLGKVTVISVYGEKFTDELARDYFKSINLEVERIDANLIHIKDFVDVKRYTREEVENWSDKVIETPIGYFCLIE